MCLSVVYVFECVWCMCGTCVCVSVVYVCMCGVCVCGVCYSDHYSLKYSLSPNNHFDFEW